MAVQRKVWLIERYARYIHRDQLTSASQEEESGVWQQFVTQDGGAKIQLVLVENSHLMITRGEHILESFSLWNAHSYVKAFQRGDSVLFIYHVQDKNRRFRIKVASTDQKSSAEVCSDVCMCLSQLMPLQNITSTHPPQYHPPATVGKETYQTTTLKEISQLKQRLIDPTKTLSRAYADSYLPTSQLPQFIRLCLSDSNFPGFVEAVEKELNNTFQK